MNRAFPQTPRTLGLLTKTPWMLTLALIAGAALAQDLGNVKKKLEAAWYLEVGQGKIDHAHQIYSEIGADTTLALALRLEALRSEVRCLRKLGRADEQSRLEKSISEIMLREALRQAQDTRQEREAKSLLEDLRREREKDAVDAYLARYWEVFASLGASDAKLRSDTAELIAKELGGPACPTLLAIIRGRRLQNAAGETLGGFYAEKAAMEALMGLAGRGDATAVAEIQQIVESGDEILISQVLGSQRWATSLNTALLPHALAGPKELRLSLIRKGVGMADSSAVAQLMADPDPAIQRAAVFYMEKSVARALAPELLQRMAMEPVPSLDQTLRDSASPELLDTAEQVLPKAIDKSNQAMLVRVLCEAGRWDAVMAAWSKLHPAAQREALGPIERARPAGWEAIARQAASQDDGSEESVRVRREALALLRKSSDPQRREIFLSNLDHKDSGVAYEARVAFCSVATAEDLPKLCQLLESQGRSGISDNITRALHRHPSAEGARAILAWLKRTGASGASAEQELESLARYPQTIAVPVLNELLADSEAYGSLRQVALKLLARLDPENSLATLEKALADADLKPAAVAALGQSLDRRALKILLPMLKDPDLEIRKAARAAIDEIQFYLDLEKSLQQNE